MSIAAEDFTFGVPGQHQPEAMVGPVLLRPWIPTPYEPVSIGNTAWSAFGVHASVARQYRIEIDQLQTRLDAGAVWLSQNAVGHPRRREALRLRQQLTSAYDEACVAYQAALAQSWIALEKVIYASTQMTAEQYRACDWLPVFVSTDVDEVWRSLMAPHPPFDRAWLEHVSLWAAKGKGAK